MQNIHDFLKQEHLNKNSIIGSDELFQLFQLLDMKLIAQMIEKKKHKMIMQHIQDQCSKKKLDKASYIGVILYMAVCYVKIPAYINPIDEKKYYLQLQPSEEGDLTNDLCSIMWGISKKDHKKSFVVKPGMMRCEHDQFLYRFFEFMKQKKLLPSDMENIFINSSPAIINISKIVLPVTEKNSLKKFNKNEYRLSYETVSGDLIEIPLNKNTNTNGLLFVGVEKVLLDCSVDNFKSWIKQKPLNFVLMMGILKLINARDLKMNGIMLDSKGNPVIIDCEDFLRQKKTDDNKPIADLHVPFIDAIINEMIPVAILKKAGQWFKQWANQKKFLLSFIKDETFIFEKRCNQAKQAEEKYFSDDQGSTHSNVTEEYINENDFLAHNSYWNDENDNGDVNQYSEDGNELDDECLSYHDSSGLLIKKFELTESIEYQSSVGHNNTDNILNSIQLDIFSKKIEELNQRFNFLSNKDKKISIFNMMHLIDKQWYFDFKKFKTSSNDLVDRLLIDLPNGSKFKTSYSALVGLFSTSSIQCENRNKNSPSENVLPNDVSKNNYIDVQS